MRLNTASSIVESHRKGIIAPPDTIRRCYERIRLIGDPGIFITLRDEAEAVAEAQGLADNGDLYGVPVVVKDNIDVAGMPTTAGCPAFAYWAEADAEAVKRLKRAGAVVVGKTNLDQFATGLAGLWTPYTAPQNPLRRDLIPGGSSAGSAVAVATGIAPLALGTDTAGSGRVPAMLNNIAGLKPSLGLISTRGVVPACRSLDCVSVFALNIDDAWTALRAIAGYDPKDPYSRERALAGLSSAPTRARLGVPLVSQRLFFGDTRAAADYDSALSRLTRMGFRLADVDIEPFTAAGQLLYDGPWLAERYLAVRKIFEANPSALYPVTRAIIAPGADLKASDTFAAFHRLAQLRRTAEEVFKRIDALVLPTAPAAYTCEHVLGDPARVNSRLGTYTNFVNLLDLCGAAVPAALHGDGTPFGITFIAPGGQDGLAASLAKAFHAECGIAPGAPAKVRESIK